jgi:hypothetical protein
MHWRPYSSDSEHGLDLDQFKEANDALALGGEVRAALVRQQWARARRRAGEMLRCVSLSNSVS